MRHIDLEKVIRPHKQTPGDAWRRRRMSVQCRIPPGNQRYGTIARGLSCGYPVIQISLDIFILRITGV
jgi:hypothetical protein